MKNNRFNERNYFRYGRLVRGKISGNDVSAYNDYENPRNLYGFPDRVFGYFRAGGALRSQEEMLVKLNKLFSGVLD